jgi:hypothetical protein
MALVRGVTLLDLIEQVPPGAQGFVPDRVAGFVNLLNITAVRTRTSERFFVHSGRVQSAADAGLRLGPDFPVEIPGLNVGVPFQLAWIRPEVAPGPEALEGEPEGWILDLFLDRVAVVVPTGRPGERVPASAVAPAHLKPGAGTRVKLYARGVLRIEGGPGGTTVRLVAEPDPIVPTTGIGTVLETGFSPPHLLLHDSGLGLTVNRVILDLTPHFTPPDIEARGHGPDFEGMTVREATVYLPRNLPFVGDVNFGVRDLLVGWEPTPALQGEARIELGLPLESATGIDFFQEVEGEVVPLGGASGSGAELTVTVHPDTGPRARLFGRMATTGVTADWRLPDGGTQVAGDSGWFEVSMAPGAPSLRVVERRTAADGSVADGQERTFAFVRAAAPDEPQHAPPIRVLYSEAAFTHQWDDVVFLRAPGIILEFVQFRAVVAGLTPEDVQGLRWQWEKEGSTRAAEGALFEPDVGWSQGIHTVTLTDRHGKVRRCRIEAVPTGALYVGHVGGGVRRVSGASDTAAPVAAVENSWDLAAFHATDARNGAREAAVREEDGTLAVPPGTLAEVTLAIGTPAEPEAPAPPAEPPFRHARVLMAYNVDIPRGWRRIRETGASPYGPDPPYPRYLGGLQQTNTPEEAFEGTGTVPDLVDALRAWTGGFPDTTRFVVVGRCCDLGPDLHNQNLANSRARRGKGLLGSAGIDAGRIRAFGEQGLAGPDPDLAAPTTEDMAELGSRVDPPGRAFLTYHTVNERSAWGKTPEQPERKEGRGVDIYAIVPAATPAENPEPTDALTKNPARIRALVPGEDADATTPMKAANVQLPYRVEIQAKWDSPSIVEPVDWVPTLLQLTVEWPSSAVPVPELPDDETVTPTRPGDAAGPDLWRLIGRFATDVRSGQTSYLLSFDSMGDADGLFAIVSPGEGRADETVAVALALAPALLGGIATDDPSGAGVRIAALIAASRAAAAIKIDGRHLVNDGSVIVEKLEGEVRLRAIDAVEGMKIRLGVDYTASFGVQAEVAGAVGAHTTQPVKIKYRNVGLEYEHDESRPLLQRVRFVFEDAAFEVADPGQWAITGALGRLLGITAIRLGAGSLWFEVDVEFALDLGVVEISRTTIRVDVDTAANPPRVAVYVRGIAAKIDVPGTIRGRGELQVLPDGFGAALELDILPAKLKAWGAFVVRDPMVHIEGGVRFATGIPLAQTGLGLFGFAGRFVSNGRRNLDGLPPTDVIAREISWHELGVLDKYRPERGQFALGFGVYIGTMPDAGFTFNALGMLTIGFPDVSVVFAIDAVLMSGEEKSATEQKASGPPPDLQLLGIVAVDPEAVGIAIRGGYEIRRTLFMEVPLGAYFPLQSSGAAGYVRVGSDGAGGRPDRPVTIRIFPDVLDLRAFSFFMVEEKHLRDLGGKPDLSFEGFSIGFGAGLSVRWGGGSIFLKASLTLLVGLGTRPFVLAGGLYVQGELRLVVVGISVSGEIMATITRAAARLEGEFCGKVSFFFFSIKGCVSFTVGSAPAIPPVEPEPLATGLVLSDKFSRVVGEGAPSLGAIGPGNRAWPDAAPTLRFAHRVWTNLSGPGFRPTPSQGWAAPEWSGTNRVRFLYELNAVELVEHPATGTPEVLDTSDWPAAWWLPAFRNAVPGDGDTAASSHEGWDLALLHWDPAPWSRALTDGGEGVDADPAGGLGNVCDPAPRPPRYCVRGQDGQRLDVGRVRVAGEPSGVSPYPPDFRLDLEEGLPPHLGIPELSALAAALGVGFTPGGRITLPAPFTPPGESSSLAGAWRTPRFTRAGFTAMSLGMRGTFVPQVSRPEVLLAVCLEVPDRGRRQEVCVDLARVRPGQELGERAMIDGVEFVDTGQRLRSRDTFPLDAPDGVSELSFAKVLVATLPEEVEAVVAEVGVLEDRAVAIVALDARGGEVDRAQAEGQPPGVHPLRVEGARIRQVQISASHGTGHLVRFCYTREAELGEGALVERILALFESERGVRLPLPRVIGFDRDGEEAWPGEVVGQSVRGRRGCAFVRYRPRREGPWRGFRILPHPWFDVSLVRACGIRHGALVSADLDDRAREELQDAWNDAATGSGIERFRLLEPNTRYEVRVRYRVATWTAPKLTDEPPDPGAFDFTPVPDVIRVAEKTERFFFRTAPAGSLPDARVLDFEAQELFDPRALARVLRGFDPVAEVPSHFRDDPLLVWFEVEWIENLLDRYGHRLELVVQRTDPPPTPPSGEAPPILPPLTITWTGLPFELRSLADRRMIEAATDAPCLEDAPVSGATAQVLADLEPRARYDLVVRAVPLSGGDPVEIGRSHFRASRYRTAVELIEATGFGIERRNPFYPPDLLVDGAPPAEPRLGDDALLDAAISALGLDPFPPAAGPRSVLLWAEVDGGGGPEPRLVGLLLDSDEALLRGPRLVDPTPNPPRLRILRARVTGVPPFAPSELLPVRSNGSATRILLAATSPIQVPEGAVLELEVQEPGAVRTGRRSLLPLPLVIAQELP